MCRRCAGTVPPADPYKLMVVVLLEQTSMGIGKRQPDGKKIVKLREQNGLKQNVLARDARISERLLRDIERRSKPVPASTITAIATALKVPAEEITIETGARRCGSGSCAHRRSPDGASFAPSRGNGLPGLRTVGQRQSEKS